MPPCPSLFLSNKSLQKIAAKVLLAAPGRPSLILLVGRPASPAALPDLPLRELPLHFFWFLCCYGSIALDVDALDLRLGYGFIV